MEMKKKKFFIEENQNQENTLKKKKKKINEINCYNKKIETKIIQNHIHISIKNFIEKYNLCDIITKNLYTMGIESFFPGI